MKLNILIPSSFIIALILNILPMPADLQAYRPQWTALVLLYWCIALPDRIGVGTAFLVGIFLDLLTATLIGQHSFSLSLIAYIAYKAHQMLRVFPLWQQALFIGFLLLLERLVFIWISGSIGQTTLSPWFSPLISALLWPWLSVILSEAQTEDG